MLREQLLFLLFMFVAVVVAMNNKVKILKIIKRIFSCYLLHLLLLWLKKKVKQLLLFDDKRGRARDRDTDTDTQLQILSSWRYRNKYTHTHTYTKVEAVQ